MEETQNIEFGFFTCLHFIFAAENTQSKHHHHHHHHHSKKLPFKVRGSRSYKRDVHHATSCLSKCFVRHVTYRQRKCFDFIHPGKVVNKCFLGKRTECGLKCHMVKKCFTFFAKKKLWKM